MAHGLATPRAKVCEFELHVFELAYLMGSMRVDSVAALPNAVLFPKDAALRQKVLGDGQKRLLESGLLETAAEPSQATYNEDLLSMAAAIADPRMTILARRESRDGQRAYAALFFNDVEAVEVTQPDRQAFRLRQMKDAPDAFQRVRKMVGVPPGSDDQSLATLHIKAFEQIRGHAAADESDEAIALLKEAGLSPAGAKGFAAALRTPQRKGIVSVLKHAGRKVTDVRVLGFFLLDGATWLTSTVDDSAECVRIEAVDSDRFVLRLVDRVASLTA